MIFGIDNIRKYDQSSEVHITLTNKLIEVFPNENTIVRIKIARKGFNTILKVS